MQGDATIVKEFLVVAQNHDIRKLGVEVLQFIFYSQAAQSGQAEKWIKSS